MRIKYLTYFIFCGLTFMLMGCGKDDCPAPEQDYNYYITFDYQNKGSALPNAVTPIEFRTNEVFNSRYSYCSSSGGSEIIRLSKTIGIKEASFFLNFYKEIDTPCSLNGYDEYFEDFINKDSLRMNRKSLAKVDSFDVYMRWGYEVRAGANTDDANREKNWFIIKKRTPIIVEGAGTIGEIIEGDWTAEIGGLDSNNVFKGFQFLTNGKFRLAHYF